MDLLQRWAYEGFGLTEPVNGSWLYAIAENIGVDLNGDLWRNIAIQGFGMTEPINGSWIQAIATKYEATRPVNGSWLQAIVDR
jgi:predicted small secreted protein